MNSRTSPPAFGFENSSFCYFKEQNSAASNRMLRNIVKVAAVVPIIGTILGIVRFVNVARNRDLGAGYMARHSVRALFETLSLGGLMVIADVVVTTFRLARLPRHV